MVSTVVIRNTDFYIQYLKVLQAFDGDGGFHLQIDCNKGFNFDTSSPSIKKHQQNNFPDMKHDIQSRMCGVINVSKKFRVSV